MNQFWDLKLIRKKQGAPRLPPLPWCSQLSPALLPRPWVWWFLMDPGNCVCPRKLYCYEFPTRPLVPAVCICRWHVCKLDCWVTVHICLQLRVLGLCGYVCADRCSCTQGAQRKGCAWSLSVVPLLCAGGEGVCWYLKCVCSLCLYAGVCVFVCYIKGPVYVFGCVCGVSGIHVCALCVHMNACVYRCAHVCICTCICMNVCVHACMCVLCMCGHVCMDLCACACICVCVCVCMCVCRLTGKDPDAGKDWRQEKGTTEDERVGWHHRLDGHEFEQAPGDGEGQGGLACCSPRGRRESDMTEQLNSNNVWMQACVHGCMCVCMSVCDHIIRCSSIFTLDRGLWSIALSRLPQPSPKPNAATSSPSFWPALGAAAFFSPPFLPMTSSNPSMREGGDLKKKKKKKKPASLATKIPLSVA